MVRLTWKRSAILHKKPEELFDLTLERLIDINRLPGATDMEVAEGPVGAGTTVRWTTPHGGLLLSDSLVITEYEPGRKIATRTTRTHQAEPGSTSTRRYANVETAATTLFEPVPGGTRMKASVQLWYSGVNTLWHPILLLAQGNTYRKQFHKRIDEMLDRIEGPSSSRKAVSYVRQIWSGWIVFALVLLALIWVHIAHEQLGISDAWLQVVRVLIGLMAVGALLGAYFMASTGSSR